MKDIFEAELSEIKFKRKYSVNPRHSLKFPLGEMSFFTDWVNSKRGDAYPLISSSDALRESVFSGNYRVESTDSTAFIRRLLGQHFPYATYALKLKELCGEVGFSFICYPEDGSDYTALSAPSLDILVCGTPSDGYSLKYNTYRGNELIKTEVTQVFTQITASSELSVMARGSSFDVFCNNGSCPELLSTFKIPELSGIHKYENFTASVAALYVAPYENGAFETDRVVWYLDGGLSHADIRPIRYEDGTPMLENGRLFFTVSSRLVEGAYQSVISLTPTACDLRLEGALFFDVGDGYWCADVASSVIYDRSTNRYLIWMCSFSHGHILARGTATGDIKHGIHVIDVRLMNTADKTADAPPPDVTAFIGKVGDEDPDIYYDAESSMWYLTVCRISSSDGGYEYFRFASSDPLEGYHFIARTGGTQETGGSTVKFGSKRYFICGAKFGERARYNVYRIKDDGGFDECKHLLCDWDDGGFRGWGTILPFSSGSRTSYLWITFDRHLGSPTYNWSYGNIYVYEARRAFV